MIRAMMSTVSAAVVAAALLLVGPTAMPAHAAPGASCDYGDYRTVVQARGYSNQSVNLRVYRIYRAVLKARGYSSHPVKLKYYYRIYRYDSDCNWGSRSGKRY
jgi:hypothetical protein